MPYRNYIAQKLDFVFTFFSIAFTGISGASHFQIIQMNINQFADALFFWLGGILSILYLLFRFLNELRKFLNNENNPK